MTGPDLVDLQEAVDAGYTSVEAYRKAIAERAEHDRRVGCDGQLAIDEAGARPVTAERCEMSDLLVDSCACQKHRAGQAIEVTRRFAATFGGQCVECGGRYYATDRIGRLDGGGYLCPACCEGA